MNHQQNEQAESQPTPGQPSAAFPHEPVGHERAEDEPLSLPIGVPVGEEAFRQLKEQAASPQEVAARPAPTESAEADPAED